MVEGRNCKLLVMLNYHFLNQTMLVKVGGMLESKKMSIYGTNESLSALDLLFIFISESKSRTGGGEKTLNL